MRVWQLALSSVIVVACGGVAAPDPDPQAIPQAAVTCPATLKAANGKACALDGLKCRMPMTCDAVNEIATCACQNGAFVCKDSFGVVPKGDEPVCAPRGAPDDSPCPPSMMVATDLACDTVGKLCTYEGPICPESLTNKPALESCVCRGEAGGGKRYVCYPFRCLGN